MMFKKLKEYLMGGMDKETISHQAKNLLQDDAFLIAYESTQERILGEIVASKPDEVSKRERLYTSYQLLDDLVFELNRLINQSDQPRQSELDQGG